MCCPWNGEQGVHSDMSKGDSVTLSITLLAHRLQEANKKFSQLSTSEARSLFEEEVCDYLADSVPSCNCDRILVHHWAGGSNTKAGSRGDSSCCPSERYTQ